MLVKCHTFYISHSFFATPIYYLIEIILVLNLLYSSWVDHQGYPYCYLALFAQFHLFAEMEVELVR